MNIEIVKNILFYGSFGSFGLYTFYEVSKSEYNRKLKSDKYFNNMIKDYLVIEDCNKDFKNYNILLKNNKEEILQLINPSKIQYDKNCIDYYNNFLKSYSKYTINKYDISYKYDI